MYIYFPHVTWLQLRMSQVLAQQMKHGYHLFWSLPAHTHCVSAGNSHVSSVKWRELRGKTEMWCRKGTGCRNVSSIRTQTHPEWEKNCLLPHFLYATHWVQFKTNYSQLCFFPPICSRKLQVSSCLCILLSHQHPHLVPPWITSSQWELTIFVLKHL